MERMVKFAIKLQNYDHDVFIILYLNNSNYWSNVLLAADQQTNKQQEVR
jgi:hypothetical protein